MRAVLLADRFWAKVDKTPGLGPKGQCWEWRGYRDRNGYGRISIGGRAGKGELAHRIAYLLVNGELPSLPLLHSCDNPPCVNPADLTPGTQAENMADKAAKGRARNPHEKLTPEQRDEIIALSNSGLSQRAIARRFGVRQCSVSALLRRRGYATGPSPAEVNRRKDRCANGHPFTGVDKVGNRICHTCGAAKTRRYRERRLHAAAGGTR